MPRGPRGEKRPADVIGNAVRVMQIATGEAEEEYEAAPEKNPGRVAVEVRDESGRPVYAVTARITVSRR